MFMAGDNHKKQIEEQLLPMFFLEKNMLSYFLHIVRQKIGGSSFVCVQLLQTLNILFENIRNETSLCGLMLTW
uniref:FPL domain-containing protein n=1 Tax=Glossina palpalis gambiensis TaxID=67801 RepID=A0A1B0BZ99_9MUSC